MSVVEWICALLAVWAWLGWTVAGIAIGRYGAELGRRRRAEAIIAATMRIDAGPDSHV